MPVNSDFIVIDTETSIKNRGDFSIGDFKASPYHHENVIVALGWKELGSPFTRTLYYKYDDISEFSVPKGGTLVGHNIKFDLLYLLREPHWQEWLKTGKVWDTMLSEYILTGQEAKYADLNSLSVKYGGTLKPDKIKEYWENGVDTEDIPENELTDYLEGDVDNTSLVAEAQMRLAYYNNMFPLITMEMDALLATTEMEFNGLYFDKELAKEKIWSLSFVMLALETKISTEMNRYLLSMSIFDVLPSSSEQLSACLFGGNYKVTEDKVVTVVDETTGLEVPYVYKTGKKKGQVKTKKEIVTYYTAGMELTPKPEWEGKKKGVYSTSEEVLVTLLKENPNTTLIIEVLEHRRLAKDINTYYKGFSQLTWPDGCIHGKIDHVGTSTSRFNSSSPNLQNLSNKGD